MPFADRDAPSPVQCDELEMYITDHCMSYDQTGSGTLDYATLKRALFELDVVALTPIQVREASMPSHALIRALR